MKRARLADREALLSSNKSIEEQMPDQTEEITPVFLNNPLHVSKDNKLGLRFGVYCYSLSFPNGQVVKRHFICLKMGRLIVGWTDFHKYIKPYRNQRTMKVTYNANNRATSVCRFLNYVFFDKYHIQSLLELEKYMVVDYLNDYGLCRLPGDKSGDEGLFERKTERSKQTVERTVSFVIDFLESVIEAEGNRMKLKKSDLYKKKKVFSKVKKREITRTVPAFDVICNPRVIDPILRDIPEKIFQILMNHIIEYHTEILMLVALQAFAGLRPAEACNVRRPDSPLGPGIKMDLINGDVDEITIDLTAVIKLRSDRANVGSIKKPRKQKVYPAFTEAFVDCYNIYMGYISGRKYEAMYGPLSINRTGKAITYRSYYYIFNQAVQECIPIMLRDEDPEVRNFGLLLQEKKLAPHAFRHWYSVKLTLYGEDVAGLMYWRGDKSPESALTYITNKSDLEREYSKVANTIFDFSLWRAERMYSDD